MFIEPADAVTDELLAALKRLIPQLGTGKVIPSNDDLAAIIRSESSFLLLARYPDKCRDIAGILTLTIYRVPTGIRSIVEDVIVDARFRQVGIGQALMERAIEIAHEAGADGIALTSNPSRVEANRLYQKMGFKKRETNSYYLGLK